jgi:hypothetical protein
MRFHARGGEEAILGFVVGTLMSHHVLRTGISQWPIGRRRTLEVRIGHENRRRGLALGDQADDRAVGVIRMPRMQADRREPAGRGGDRDRADVGRLGRRHRPHHRRRRHVAAGARHDLVAALRRQADRLAGQSPRRRPSPARLSGLSAARDGVIDWHDDDRTVRICAEVMRAKVSARAAGASPHVVFAVVQVVATQARCPRQTYLTRRRRRTSAAAGVCHGRK